MTDSIASVFVDVILNTKDIGFQLLTDPRLQGLKIKVDSGELHQLNKLYDLKKKHHIELATHVKNNPISPKVDSTDLHKLNSSIDSVAKNKVPPLEIKTRGIDTVNTEINKVVEHIDNLRKTTTVTVKAGVKFDKNQVAKEFENITTKTELIIKDDRKAAKKPSSFLTGFQEEIGRNATKTVSSALRRNFDFDSKKSADKLADKLIAPVKIFISENPELKASLTRTSNLIEDRLRKAGYAIGDAIVKGLDDRTSTIKGKINNFVAELAPKFGGAATQIKQDVSTIAKDTGSSIVSGGNSQVQEKVGDFIQNYKRGALKDIVIPEAIARAEAIAAKGKKSNTANVVTDDTKELIIATGGYAGARGLSGKRLATALRKDAGEGTEVIWTQNKDSDIPEGLSKASDRAKALITSMSKPNLRGYSKDSIEMVAQALVAIQKNPDLRIKLLGESGGGDVAAEAAQALKMMGVRNVSYAGVGTPDFVGGYKDAPGTKFISPDEYLGAETHKFYNKLGLARTDASAANILGVGGHPFEHYQEANVAELQNFLKGKPQALNKEEIGNIKQASEAFADIDTSQMGAKELEKLGKQAYANLQTIRRQIIDGIGEPNQELVAIAKTFESVYIKTSPDKQGFGGVRAAIAKSKDVMERVEAQPGLEAARVAKQINEELSLIQSEFRSKFKSSVGTDGRKYQSLDAQLSEQIKRSEGLDFAIPARAREDLEISSTFPKKPEGASQSDRKYFAWDGGIDPLESAPIKAKGVDKTENHLDISAGKLSTAADRLIEAADRLAYTPPTENIPLSKVDLIPHPDSEIEHTPIKDFAVQGVNLVANGIVNISGKAIGAIYGAEKAILGKGGANLLNTVAAGTLAANIPGGQALLGAAAEGLGAIAHVPLSAISGQSAAAIGEMINTAIGNAPILKALAPQLTAAITEAMAGGAAALSGTIGSVLTPLLAGAGILKGAEVGAKMLPGFDEAGTANATFNVQNGVLNLLKGTANLVGGGKQLGSAVRNALPQGAIDGEFVTPEVYQLPAQNISQLPEARIITQDYEQRALPPAAIDLTPQPLNAGLKLSSTDNKEIESEVERIRNRINTEKAAISKLLRSNNPKQIEEGLVRAGSLGLGFVHLKSDLRAIVKTKTLERDELVADNPGYKPQNIPGYRDIQSTINKARGLAQDEGATTRPIYEQIEKLGKDEKIVGKINPNLIKNTAIGTGVFGTILAALTTGAQAATVGGGAAVGGGGLLAALTPLLPLIAPALAGGAVGGGLFLGGRKLYQNYQANRNQSPNPQPPTSNPQILTLPDPQPDPVGGIKSAISGTGEKLRGVAGLIGAGIVGLIGFQFVPMVMGFITQNIGAAITKAIAQEGIALTLKATSPTQSAITETLKASKSLANQLGVSELETRGNIANFQSSIVDTPLEGQGAALVSAVTKYGKSRGATNEQVGRGVTAFSQVAGKGQLYAEEVFGQLAEALPGSPTALASASGLTVKQLRALMQAGGANSTSILSRFSGRANAEGDLNLAEFTNSPQAKIGRLSNSAEKLQLNLGEAALVPLGAGADTASKAIDLLTNNIGLLAQLGGIAILKFGADVLGVFPILKGLSLAVANVNMSSFASGIGMAGNSLKTLLLLAVPLAEFAIVAGVALVALDLLFAKDNEGKGGETFGKTIADDMEKAYQAIKKVNDESKGLPATIDTSKLREEKFEKNKSFTDRLGEFAYGSSLSEEANKDFYDKQIKSSLGKLTESSITGGKVIQEANAYKLSDKSRKRIDELNLELQLLGQEEGTDRGLDPAKGRLITDKQTKAITERNKLEQPLQQYSTAIEVAIKAAKSTIDDPLAKLDPAYKKVREEALILLPKLEAAQKQVNKELSVETLQRAQTAYAIENMTNKLSASRLEIDRFATRASTDLSVKYTGSLAVGSRTREQSDLDISVVSKKIEALTNAIAQNKAILDRPEVSAGIKQLQGEGRLPSDLSATSDEQLKYIKSDPTASKTISKNDLIAIENMRAYTDELDKSAQSRADLTEKRKSAIAAELKASNEYYINSIYQIKQTELASIEASRDIKSKSYSSQFKGALQGVNSASAGYMNALIDQFAELGNITKIETDRQKTDYELRKGEFDARVNRDNRQNSNTIDGTEATQSSGTTSGATVVSPLKDVSIQQLIDYKPIEGLQDFKAHRNRKANSPKVQGYKQGADVHGALDYDRRVGGGLGAEVIAPISGTATVQNAGPGYAQMIYIVGKDADGILTKIGLTHINAKIKTGTEVQAGQSVGVVAKLGPQAKGAPDHLDFTVQQGDQKIHPNDWWKSQLKAPVTTSAPIKSPALTPEVLEQSRKYQEMYNPKALPPKFKPIDSKFFQDRGYQSALLQDLETGKTIAEYNSGKQPASSGSTLKLLLAQMVRKKVAARTINLTDKITLDPSLVATGDSVMSGKTYDLATLLKMSIKDSNNTAANGLIKALGGVDTVNAGFKTMGYSGSTLGNLFSLPGVTGFKNKTTAKDTNSALMDFYRGSDPAATIVRDSLFTSKNKLGYKGDIAGKIGNNSKVLGYSGIADIGGKKYALSQFYDTPDSVESRSKLVTNTNELEKRISVNLKSIKAPTIKTSSKTYSSSESGTTVTASTFAPGRGGMNGSEVDARDRKLTEDDYAVAIPGIKKFPNSIPYGSKIRITLNGKSVIAEVRDGGPYIPGRKLDLTTAAAKKIGLTGVEPVKVELIELPKGADPNKDYTFGEATYKPKLSRKANTPEDFEEIRKAVRSVRPSGSIRLSGQGMAKSIDTPAISSTNLPTSTGSPRLDNDAVYNEQITASQQQRQRNNENSQTLTEDLKLGAAQKAVRDALEGRKRLRDERLKRQEEDRNKIREADGIGYKSPKDELNTKLRDANWKREDTREKIEFDRSEINEEVLQLKQLDISIKAVSPAQRSKLGKEQLSKLQEIEAQIPKNLKDAEARLRWIDEYAIKSEKVAAGAEKFIRDDYAGNERFAEMSRKIEERNREIGALNLKKTEIETYQKTNPLDISKGDPLLIQAQIDRATAANIATQETIDLDTKARALDKNDPKVKAFIERGRNFIQQKYNETLKNISDGLNYGLMEAALARDERALTIENFNVDSRLSVRSAQGQFYGAEGRTGTAKKIEYDDGFIKREQEKKAELLKLDRQIKEDPSRKADLEQAKKDVEAKYNLGVISTATQFQRERDLRVRGLGESVESSRIQGVQEQAGLIRTQGNIYDAGVMEKEAAYAAQALEISQKYEEFKIQLKAELPGSEEYKNIEKLREQYEKLSEIKLTKLKEQFSEFNGLITETQKGVGSIVDSLFRGEGIELKEVGRSILSSIINPIADLGKSTLNGWIKSQLGGVVEGLNSQMPNRKFNSNEETGTPNFSGIGLAQEQKDRAAAMSMPTIPEFKIVPVLPEDPRIVAPSDKIERMSSSGLSESLGYRQSSPPVPVDTPTRQNPTPVEIISTPKKEPSQHGGIIIPPPPTFDRQWQPYNQAPPPPLVDTSTRQNPTPVEIIATPKSFSSQLEGLVIPPPPTFDRQWRPSEQVSTDRSEINPLPVKIIGYTAKDAAIRDSYSGFSKAALPSFSPMENGLFGNFGVSRNADILPAFEEASQTLQEGALEASQTLADGGQAGGGFLFDASKFAANAIAGAAPAPSGGGGGGGGGFDWLGAVFNIGRKILKFKNGGTVGYADGGTIDSNGVLNSHLPPSPIDNRFIKLASGGNAMLRDGESILTPETTKGLGGGAAIESLNAQFKFAEGGTLRGSTLPPEKNFNPSIPSQSRSPLRVEYTKIGDRNYIDQENLDNALREQDERNQRALTEYDRRQQDLQQHSVVYRNSRR